MKCKIGLPILLALPLVPFASLKSQPVSRHILALYDSERGQTTSDNHIHANAEVVLNYLGCIVDYWNLKNGLPDEKYMQKYLGVLTWFYNNGMRQPEAYLKWASTQIDAKRKFVILGNIGAFRDLDSGNLVKMPTLNKFTKKLGFIVSDANWTADITKIELVYKNRQMIEFERSLDFELTNYANYRSINPGAKVYLKLTRSDIPKSESDIVFTTPKGGFAASGYIIYEVRDTHHNRKWRLNPFSFFEEAFGLKEIPKPDITTLNGMRIWTSHIDGDALISLSQIKHNTYCGQIVRDEILKKYKWPFSVSVVVGEVEKDRKFVDIARSIYKLAWIEAASHSYAHPYYWKEDDREKDKYSGRHLPIAGYTFNLEKEINGSVKYINENLLPPGKEVKQFFWTGNCKPQPEAIKLCEEISIRNMNGGDSVFDQKNKSYTSLAPLSVDVGGYRQVYAPNANENIYTDEWHGPFYGFKYVLETFKNTESPIRIKPINIYYHFYMGERWAALNSLKEVLQKTITQDVAPMFISDYLSVVDGFFDTTIEQMGDRIWRVNNFGNCTTIRFDHNEKFPDLEKSIGVLGFSHLNGSLYIHLADRDEAKVVLTNTKPKKVYLDQSSHRIRNWRSSKTAIAFKTEGFGKGKFTIANLPENRRYEISMNQNKLVLSTDANGMLSFMRSMDGPVKVEMRALK